MTTDHRDAIYEVRELWHQHDGSIIVYSQQVVPRRWWNHVTRPVGLVLILLAVAWPVVLVSHGWPRLGWLFALGDGCVVVVGLDLMRSGAKRWSDE